MTPMLDAWCPDTVAGAADDDADCREFGFELGGTGIGGGGDAELAVSICGAE
eukprot:CAMPEP_0176427072 /NCGR_PEP_ID=MMETSP0127-20121128/12321_1 /TAXON_ID=938130 /ORGANISM="Platyophrya macrostoma, Strain WH" /LENGTH=51 /DNA_ID=CAMNT_0017808463 /DNA_START=285 /DNA_END=441 /DNA_ORIENTATION=-